MTFALPTLTVQPATKLRELFSFTRSGDPEVAPRRTDAVTGLLLRDFFVDEASELLETACRERREVAVFSILVEGIDTDGERYIESDANVLLRGATSALNRLAPAPRALGRVGLAEFGWAELIDSRRAAWRTSLSAIDSVNRSIARAGVAPVATATLGMTLSRGRRVDVETLLVEARGARRRQDGAPVSTAS